MYDSDYKKELALKGERPIPAIIAFLLITAFTVSLWFGYESLKPHFTTTSEASSGE